ncbi:hypothetical protein NEUTE2DRAFT_168372 [Neurospora tetrasperma FGSC 2509]|nr:hypothetical protein NEUTE2DRAFT_168372 [Neurospora tetrasperma FGSC 2509]
MRADSKFQEGCGQVQRRMNTRLHFRRMTCSPEPGLLNSFCLRSGEMFPKHADVLVTGKPRNSANLFTCSPKLFTWLGAEYCSYEQPNILCTGAVRSDRRCSSLRANSPELKQASGFKTRQNNELRTKWNIPGLSRGRTVLMKRLWLFLAHWIKTIQSML